MKDSINTPPIADHAEQHALEDLLRPVSVTVTDHRRSSVRPATGKASILAGMWCDILIITMLAVGVGFASFQQAQRIDPVIFHRHAYNIWFDADPPNTLEVMTARKHDSHLLIYKHPLFSLVAYPPVYLLKTTLNIEQITAVRLVIAAIASLWISVLFVTLRLIGCWRFDAVLFSLLGISTASAMFWLVVPEIVSFASLSILLGIGFVAMAQRRHLSAAWCVVISVVTFSITITNWMVGILATIVCYPWKRSLQITLNAFCIVVLLWAVQKLVFPKALFFFEYERYANSITHPDFAESRSPQNVIKGFVLDSVIMPAINVTRYINWPDNPAMSVQRSFPGSASLWGAMGVAVWILLLGLGLWGLFSVRENSQLRTVLGFTLLGQLAIHTLYARETFLHSLHWAPLLIIVGAFSTLTRARLFGLLLAATLTGLAGINNFIQLGYATEFVRNWVTDDYVVQRASANRLDDPWPRGTGHVVLATPGSRDIDKAYYEPGGSFSPAVGSLGVSIWIADPAGNLKTTSDTVPLNLLRQRFVWSDAGSIPSILTETIYYRAMWSSAGPGRWVLNLRSQANSGTRPMMAVRSVGPAGGPIRSLEWNGRRLLVNDRWALTVQPVPLMVHIGEEGPQDWTAARSDLERWRGDQGWGYARFELAAGRDHELVIEDTSSVAHADVNLPVVRSPIELDLPDDRFAAVLRSQAAHLMMGLVGQETRAGDPMSYPSASLREEAYIIVALARAGQLALARELSRHVAENDFFGDLGAEADAPGLAIWALVDLAMQLKQPEYNKWLWPHVQRKTQLILDMLSTNHPMRKAVETPILPIYRNDRDIGLVAEPAKNGLINGRVDRQRPLLYVNAVSYRGLLDAALLAERVNQIEDARQLRARAIELRQAWTRALRADGSLRLSKWNASALWPTWVADRQSFKLFSASEDGCQARHVDHFRLAEAHQWLLLGREDRPWATLACFWDNQSSPGLFTWSEGEREKTPVRWWKRVRGWVAPPHITPHYWTAAEMLLLQLDMLAYSDEAAHEPTLVIGAGVQGSWLDRSMKVKGIATRIGQVNWAWDGREMRVEIRGGRARVRLGPAFPGDTPLHVEYLG